MGALPTGTVTLVLGDLEGSTRLWEERREEMRDALVALEELLDEVVTKNNGARPLEQGAGDSFVAGFPTASDAVACALAIQRETANGMLRYRLGIHTGEVELRDPDNYIGPTINRAARIRDAGHGGQILLTQTAADLVIDHLPDTATLVDRGVHLLRDLGRPEHVWELVDPSVPRGLALSHTALRGLGGVPNNLGLQLTAFVGRASELSRINALLDDARAVTLTGAGGSGKTRLAVQIAAGRLDAYPDGAWVADLAAANETSSMLDAVCEGVGMGRATDPTEALTRHIGARTMLLILDNCEHLIEDAASLAEALLRSCPSLTVVATSREPLGISGEVTYRVPSLSPDDAIELFIERARRARPQFTVDDSNRADVVEICARLEGMPLAIELAAARLRTLTPRQIREGLQNRFRLLVGGARTAVPRHQTLQASVDWSYALLHDAERTVLDRLSVFANGFTLDAAEAVCSGDGVEPHHVLDLLTQLVDKSLVVQDEDAGRFALLETVRQYAATRLADAGMADLVRQRHYAHYFDVLKISPVRGDTEATYRAAVAADYENIRRALQWADESEDPSLLGHIASRLYLYWTTSGRTPEGARWYARVVERPAERGHHVTSLARWSLLLTHTGDYAGAAVAAEDSIAAARELGDERVLLWALLFTWQAMSPSRAEFSLEAASLAETLDDQSGLAWAMFQVGWDVLVSDPEASLAPLERSRSIAVEVGADWIERLAHMLLLMRRVALGEVRSVIEEFDRAIERGLEADDVVLLPTALAVAALLHELSGDAFGADRMLALTDRFTDEQVPGAVSRRAAAHTFIAASRANWEDARAAVQSARDAALPDQDRYSVLCIASVIIGLAGDAEGALEAGEAAKRFEPQVALDPMWGLPADFSLAFAHLARGELELAETFAQEAFAVVARRAVPTWARYWTLCLAATLRAAADNYETALRLVGAIDRLVDEAGIAFSAMDLTNLVDLRNTAVASVGADRTDALLAEGAALSWEEALAYATRGRGSRAPRAVSGWESLTPTERQVVDLVAGGATNKDVADRLFMSVATVKSHLTHAYAKLGVTSRSQLAAAAASLKN